MQTTSYWREAVANLTAALIIGWRRARCASCSAGSRAVVAIGDSGAVDVGSLKGDLRVANADGVRVANVGAANSVELRVELVETCRF